MKRIAVGFVFLVLALIGGGIGSQVLNPSSAQVWKWSQTAGTNASVDSSINWAEGMSPSAVNDSARAMMARLAQWRDDTSGALTTSGTSTAYTLTTNSGLTALTAGYRVCFIPHTASGGTTTLAVDGLTAKPLRSAPATELISGALTAGTPYCATYYTTNSGEYILRSAPVTFATPWTTGDVKLTLKTTADTGWIMMNDGTIGGASSGATRANADTEDLFSLLFSNVSDTYAPLSDCSSGSNTRASQGTASTAFGNNCKMALTKVLGRALAIAGSGSGLTARSLGQTAGAETSTIAQANLPNVNFQVTASQWTPTITFTTTVYAGLGTSTGSLSGGGTVFPQNVLALNGNTFASSNPAMNVPSGGSGTALSIIDPTSFLNAEIKL